MFLTVQLVYKQECYELQDLSLNHNLFEICGIFGGKYIFN
jgi:hypothetical protein